MQLFIKSRKKYFNIAPLYGVLTITTLSMIGPWATVLRSPSYAIVIASDFLTQSVVLISSFHRAPTVCFSAPRASRCNS